MVYINIYKHLNDEVFKPRYRKNREKFYATLNDIFQLKILFQTISNQFIGYYDFNDACS